MSSGSPPPTYQLPGQSQVATGALGDINTLQNSPNYAAQTYAQMAPGFQQQIGAASQNMAQTGAAEQAAVAGLPAYAQQMLQTGFDPQSALYSRTYQQLQDQTRAALEARGIDSSPYGAGVEANALGNFNIDWQNTQLGREQTAAQGAEGLYGQYQTGMTSGSQLQAGGAELTGQGLAALQNAGAMTYAQPLAAEQAALNYLGQANQNTQTAMSGYNAQQQAKGSGIGGIAEGLGSIAAAPFTGGTSLIGAGLSTL